MLGIINKLFQNSSMLHAVRGGKTPAKPGRLMAEMFIDHELQVCVGGGRVTSVS